jgi:hypothetical protein
VFYTSEGTGVCGALGIFEIFGLNATGFLSKIAAIVSFLTDSFSILLQHPLQLQFLQYSPLAKHSQYSFRHLEFLQLQFFLPLLIPGIFMDGPENVGVI